MLHTLKIFMLFFGLQVIKRFEKLHVNLRRFEPALTSIQIRAIGSNHPRRLDYFIQDYSFFNWLRRMFRKPRDAVTIDTDSAFSDHAGYLEKLVNKHVIFIGDSHVEFFGRCHTAKGEKGYASTSALWLGPKTLLGYAGQADLDLGAKQISAILNPIAQSALRKNKRLIIVWCMGTIDIRFSIYELLLRGVVPSEAVAFDLFENAVEHIISIHLKKIIGLLPYQNIDLGYLCCTNIVEDGHHPKTTKEIKYFRRIEAFPTFGSLSQRDKWMIEANKRIKNVCKKYNVTYFDHAMSNPKQDRSKLSFCGVHLTKPKEIDSAMKHFIGLCGDSHE